MFFKIPGSNIIYYRPKCGKVGFSGFLAVDQLPQLKLPSQKGNQWAPIAWGLAGIIQIMLHSDHRQKTSIQLFPP